MAFPASVNQLSSSRKRLKKPRIPRARSPDGIADDIPPGVGVGGPTLDFGRDGAVRLIKDNKRWKWDWIGKNEGEIKVETSDEPLLLFPGLKEPDPEPADVNPTELLHASDRYLQSILDDGSDSEPYNHLAIRDLLSDSLIDDLVAEQRGPKRIDPYDGEKVVVIKNPRAKVAKTLIGFVTGKVGHQLNLSPILPSAALSARVRRMRFVPTAEPLIEFPTPILQICSSPVISPSRLDNDATCLIVRTHATTHYYHIVPSLTFTSHTRTPSVTYKEIGSISTLYSTDKSLYRHMDVALHPTEFGKALIVDELGAVFLWSEEKQERSERLYSHLNTRKIREGVKNHRDSFFRIAWGTRPGTALVMSRTTLTLLDIEGSEEPELLLELRGDRRMFTSLDKTALETGSTYTVVSTTFEVIWVDECVSAKPAMSWTHDYGNGRVKDLEVKTLVVDGQDSVALSSKSEKAVMVFHVPSNPPIISNATPAILSITGPGVMLPLTSLLPVKIQRPYGDRDASTVLLGQSADGALWSVPLALNDRSRFKRVSLKVRWNEAVERLGEVRDSPVNREVEEGEDVVGMSYRTYDFRWAWEEINSDGFTEDIEPFDIAEYQAHLREIDAPLEHLMTAGDLARDLIHGQTDYTRSNLLRPLHTESDFSAEFNQLNISRHLSVIHQLDSSIAELDTFPVPKVPGKSDVARRHTMDVARLALDLTLSRTIVNSEDIVATTTNAPDGAQPEGNQDSQATEVDWSSPEDIFAQRAGQLSLNDKNEKEPNLIELTYLHSRAFHLDTPSGAQQQQQLKQSQSQQQESSYLSQQQRQQRQQQSSIQSLSARALMEEWTIGSDPKEYTWKPWIGDVLTRSTVSPPPQTQPSQLSQLSRQSRHSQSNFGLNQSQRPIKPLPGLNNRSPIKNIFASSSHSPHSHQLQSQYAIPQRQPPTLRSSNSVPSLIPLPPVLARSSPPPEPSKMGIGSSQNNNGLSKSGSMTSLDGMGGGFVQTQVEPGRFGGRVGGAGGGKKKVKKRAGGF